MRARRNRFATIGVALLAAIAYFVFWPVPVEPVAWNAPIDRGFVDPFAPNDLLAGSSTIELVGEEGPEDAAQGPDGFYVSTFSGKILRIRNGIVDEFADVGGKPLGIEAAADGSLVVANAVLGLQRISPHGSVTPLVTEVNGMPLVYTNNLSIAADGKIYFSQASAKFGAAEFGGTYPASILDLVEHGGHGAIFVFDPASGNTRTLVDGLNFANGVAISADGSYLIIAETGHYRILKHWLSGMNAGKTDVLLDNLPGFPDNVKNGLNDRFWIGMAAPRNAMIDNLSAAPFARKMIMRLPKFLRPQAEPLSHVFAINGNGDVLMNLHDPGARFPTLTGVLETQNALFLTTLFGNQLPVVDKRNLGN